MKLFEISAQFHELEKLADSDEIPAEVIRDTLESVEASFEDKAVAVAKMVLSLEAEAAAINDAAKKMEARSRSAQRRADSLRAYLLFQFQSIDKKRIETDELVLNRRANPVAVQITNEHAIPPEFWVQPEPPPKRIDKKAVKDALQAGAMIDGAFLESGERLEIKL